jgi:hypothetical protein
LPNGLNLACAGCLEQGQAIACCLLGILEALSLEFDFQAGPFIRIHGLKIGSFQLAIRCGLWREQHRVRPANSRFRVPVLFRVPAGACSNTDGSCFDLLDSRIEIALRRIAGATGDEQNGTDVQNFPSERAKAGGTQPRILELAQIASTTRWTHGRHAHDSSSNRG